MAQPQSAIEETNAPQGDSDDRRERSKIGFPYQSLNEAAQIAKAVHDLSGASAEIEQIAAKVEMSPNSSGFVTKISSAKVFGLVSGGKGAVTLTTLGRQICDPDQEKAARVTAFLNVPLYKAIYDQFKGGTLPGSEGLETTIVTLGVPAKQKERARQIFQRSAQEAGFFQFGTNKLVLPAIKASGTAAGVLQEEFIPENEDESPRPEKRGKGSDSGGGDELHPFIQGLLKELPAAKTEWPIEKRAKWLQTAANMFDMIYLENDDDNKRSINIDLKKDSAK